MHSWWLNQPTWRIWVKFFIIFPKAPNSWSSKTNYKNLWTKTTIRQKLSLGWTNTVCAPESKTKHMAHEVHHVPVRIFGCFLKWWYPHFTPQVMIIFYREKPMGLLGTTHHFRVHPPKNGLQIGGLTPLMNNTIENASRGCISFYKGQTKSLLQEWWYFSNLDFPQNKG